MNDQQDQHDAQLDPVTFAPPLSRAYLVHNTCWGTKTTDVLKVYTTRPEADLARDAAEALTSTDAGWVVSPFCHDSTLGEAVRLNIRVVGYGQPYQVEVTPNGRYVAKVYESELPY